MSAANSPTLTKPANYPPAGTLLMSSIKEHFGLWVMTVSGILLIFCFGFGNEWSWMKRLVNLSLNVSLSPSESWELGAISWSLLFGVYYYFTFPFLPKDRLNRMLLAVLSIGTMALCSAAAYSLHSQNGVLHFRYVAAIGFLFCITDFVLFWWHQGDRRRIFLESLWVADAPMIAGLATLLIFQVYHRSYAKGEMQIFLAGAISFQLIVSNVVFILCQFGVLRKIWSQS